MAIHFFNYKTDFFWYKSMEKNLQKGDITMLEPPKRTEESREVWIDNLSALQRKAIRYASVDMWKPCYYAVRKKPPRAEIVADRFIFEKTNDRSGAERYLRVWKCKVPDTGNIFMKKFINTLENQQEQILNYFFERVTNGFVEGMNRAIKIIIRRAFRYRNFESFRLQVLAEHSFPTNPR